MGSNIVPFLTCNPSHSFLQNPPCRHKVWITKKMKRKSIVPLHAPWIYGRLPKYKTYDRTGVTGDADEKAVWSSGTVIDPGPRDCPLGDKGNYPYKLPDGGIQYFGFAYYPRTPDAVDPPIEPAPLHMVSRMKSLRKKPWWEKNIMKRIGLGDSQKSDVVVVKNNPETNAMLWRVKHMVRITPLRVPLDLPDDADPACCFIKENGDFIYNPSLRVDDKELEVDQKVLEKKWNSEFIKWDSIKKWDSPWQIKME